MTLSPIDDFPIHQTSEPIRFVGTSDRNFYDRHYINLQDGSGNLFCTFGLGVYPNLGVMDAFASVRLGDDLQVIRSSRVLGADRCDTTVGPITFEVLEGLKRLRVIVEPNEWDFAMDIIWDGQSPPYMESRQIFERDHNGRVTHHTSRFIQTGRWTGTMERAGQMFGVKPSHWTGVRDRSWGVRPVGDPEPEKAVIGAPVYPDILWNWAPMLFDDYSIVYVAGEDGDGNRSSEDAVRIWHESGEVEQLGRPEHEMEFISGTREIARARITMMEPSGKPLVIEVEPLINNWVQIGTGYGGEDGWRHGKYQGDLTTNAVRYDLSDPEDRAKMYGAIDAAARFRIGDDVGYGMFEYGVFGRNRKYGFATGKDVAP